MPNNRTSISTSVRRYFVDNFFFSKSFLLTGDKKIIDIGGKRGKKRGLFDIEKINKNVTYVNIAQFDNPDIVADAADIPLESAAFDIAIMGELLEHVENPTTVLAEAYRLLKPGGFVLASVPFLYPIHADPHDYGRYTESFWNKAAKEVGFKEIELERHGTIFAVLALAVQHIFLSKEISWRPVQMPLISFLMWLDKRTLNKHLRAWTTGYGIMLSK